MTVAELIEKLSTLNPDHDVLIEVDHGDVRDVNPAFVDEVKITEHGSVHYEEVEDEETRDIVLIRA